MKPGLPRKKEQVVLFLRQLRQSFPFGIGNTVEVGWLLSYPVVSWWPDCWP